MLSPRGTTASRACNLLRPDDDSARLGSGERVLTRASDLLAFRARPVPLTAGVDRGVASYEVAGPVDLINSAKSPIDSLSTLASRGWGAFGRNLVPIFEAGLGTGLNPVGLTSFGDLGTSIGIFGWTYLLTDDE